MHHPTGMYRRPSHPHPRCHPRRGSVRISTSSHGRTWGRAMPPMKHCKIAMRASGIGNDHRPNRNRGMPPKTLTLVPMRCPPTGNATAAAPTCHQGHNHCGLLPPSNPPPVKIEGNSIRPATSQWPPTITPRLTGHRFSAWRCAIQDNRQAPPSGMRSLLSHKLRRTHQRGHCAGVDWTPRFPLRLCKARQCSCGSGRSGGSAAICAAGFWPLYHKVCRARSNLPPRQSIPE